MEEGDFAQLRVAPDEQSVVEAAVITVQGGARHTVKAADGSLVCAQVTVSRKSGIASPRSAIRCQTAG